MSQVATLYRQLIREAYHMNNYNFRNHAVRRIRWGFRNSSLSAEEGLKEGRKALETLKRQVVVNNLYPEGMSVLDSQPKK